MRKACIIALSMVKIIPHNIPSITAKATHTAAYGKLDINVKAQGDVARINIIGEIYGGWSDSEFRYAMKLARKEGAKNIQVYINSVGGDCFAANEIVNVMKEFIAETGGTITGRGGALVASAGTYIAVHCDSFSMASNGEFMIHKPMGGLWGNADQFESVVKLLRNLEEKYAQAYASKTGIDQADIEALYAKADYWMNATEAKAKGFIDSIDGEEAITEETRAMFAACGRTAPQVTAAAQQPTKQSNQQDDKMELKLTAAALALSTDATEAQVTAEIKRLRDAESRLKVMEANQAQAAVDARTKKTNTTLDNAVQSMRIAADARDYYKSKLEAASNDDAKYNALIAEIEAMTPAKSLNGGTKPSAQAPSAEASAIPAERADWDFKKWQKEDPKGWEALAKADDPEALRIFNAHHNTNRTSLIQ